MDRKLFNFKNIAMVAVFSLIAFVGFNSFTESDSEIVKREIPVQWIFTGDSEVDILNFTKYSKTEDPHEDCGNGTELPCVVDFPEGTDETSDLETYLTAENRTEADVLALSVQKRDVIIP
jgi:hypothetical protein